MPVLRRLPARDVTIRHHYTGDPLHLHSYRHRGYWFNGRDREAGVIGLYFVLIGLDATVIEVGAHIGYQTLIFSMLAPDGEVLAYEPGPNNIRYLLRNTKDVANVAIRRCAVSDDTRDTTLWCEELSGQNNSLMVESRLEENARSAHFGAVIRYPFTVPATTIDTDAAELSRVDFVKIDAEGAERMILAGARKTIASERPVLMVEIERGNGRGVFEHLVAGEGYQAFDPSHHRVIDGSTRVGNTFFLHPERHRRFIENLSQLTARPWR